MKLTAFRIKNFRSIIDTGWHELAHDNITCLIGQNESGKTSILEGLKAFHDGMLVEDMLRSDLSMPKVSCRYRFDKKEILDHIDVNKLHPVFQDKLDDLEFMTITRIWEPDLSSTLTIGEELMTFFKAEKALQKERESSIIMLLEKNAEDLRRAIAEEEQARNDCESIREKLHEVENSVAVPRKGGRSLFPRARKGKEQKGKARPGEEYEKLKRDYDSSYKSWQEKIALTEKYRENDKLQEQLETLRTAISSNKEKLVEAQKKFQQFPDMIGVQTSDKELRAADAVRENYRLEIETARSELRESNREYELWLLTVEKIFTGEDPEKARKKALSAYEKQEEILGPERLGEALFSLSPDFEMFEDFSSLLPNRIDLDDIMTSNTSAEGYKAAINFLTITGLDYSFFQQPSGRILKQKIENLNGELTLNFQEFWRQNVGKNNKIKINFELAHYDESHEEKSGKPFIEFWIKDESERLYPKQRSRGVRWFLSFFMELKATAMDKNRQNRLLLIDEPGVSLHARAQEDVLKVFDDIKEQMQIIYSTHSPHLIDVNKLYRVLAVQRAFEDDMNSETVVLNARSLRSATADTLSPIYSMMGASLSQQEIIKVKNNVVVKDLATYYFLKAILKLTGYTEKECFFLPASGTASMPMMVNILIGWGLDYLTLNFGNEEENYIYNKLRKDLFENNVDAANSRMIHLAEFPDVEDLFSTIDFKKHIVHLREGITVRNSEYLKDNNHSRAILASRFLQSVDRKEIKMKDMDEETRDNLEMLMGRLSVLLQ